MGIFSRSNKVVLNGDSVEELANTLDSAAAALDDPQGCFDTNGKIDKAKLQHEFSSLFNEKEAKAIINIVSSIQEAIGDDRVALYMAMWLQIEVFSHVNKASMVSRRLTQDQYEGYVRQGADVISRFTSIGPISVIDLEHDTNERNKRRKEFVDGIVKELSVYFDSAAKAQSNIPPRGRPKADE